MSNIVITDMRYDEELDRQALVAVMGGKSFWGKIKSAARRVGKFVWKNRKHVVISTKRIAIRGWF